MPTFKYNIENTVEAFMCQHLMIRGKEDWHSLPKWLIAAYESGGVVFTDNGIYIPYSDGYATLSVLVPPEDFIIYEHNTVKACKRKYFLEAFKLIVGTDEPIVDNMVFPVAPVNWVNPVTDNKTEILPCKQTCSKCGSGDVYHKFYDKGSNIDSGLDYVRDPSEYIEYNGYTHIAKKDLIYHYCRGCTYKWQTDPLSSPTNELVKK